MAIDRWWVPRSIGSAEVTAAAETIRLLLPTATAERYSDAEIDDRPAPGGLRHPWRPPLRLTLRACFSHPDARIDGAAGLRGTAGFGFWNEPFMVGQQGIRPPESVWFFYASPPSRMLLIPDGQPAGWKAQIVHTRRPGAIAALIPTAAAVLWARVTGQTAAAARWVQRLSGARESILATDLTAWHHYQLDWQPRAATFSIDGAVVGVLADPPPGPLGFVAWLDNQYAIVTPRAQFKFGLLACGPQWLEIADLAIVMG